MKIPKLVVATFNSEIFDFNSNDKRIYYSHHTWKVDHLCYSSKTPVCQLCFKILSPNRTSPFYEFFAHNETNISGNNSCQLAKLTSA